MAAKLSKIARLFSRGRRSSFRELLNAANARRDARDFSAAADLYAQVLARAPHRHDLRIQHGHMLKETGALEQAERAYLTAADSRSDDADLALQLGHFYAVAARDAEAERWYRRATELDPTNADATRRLQALESRRPIAVPAGITDAELRNLTPSLDPDYARVVEIIARDHHVEIKQLGRMERSRWGRRRTLHGVEAIRGYRLAWVDLAHVEVVIGSEVLHRESLRLGRHPTLRKFVFNIWLDVSGVAPGLHRLELRFTDVSGSVYRWVEDVVVREASPADDDITSDSLAYLDPADPSSVEEQVRALPSMVRGPPAPPFPEGIRSILLLRTDQLGDLVASLPAIVRLKEIAPAAKLVILLTEANAALARTLDLFDEVIVIDFPDDPVTRQRLMSLEDQAELGRRLAAYQFDIAIDLASSHVSRPLLQLSGARLRYGFNEADGVVLDGMADIRSPDRRTRMDRRPHSTKVLALIEATGGLLASPAPLVRRTDLSRSLLEQYGVAPQTRFALLHTGARIGFSRWPYYRQLVERLLAETDLTVVIIAPDKPSGDQIALADHARLIRISRKIPFDDLDAFLSFATVMVGNDSGPKHLAALRGTPVVTLFSARIGWAEWGQEQSGAIISRRVPCAGCAIFHDDDECGKEFACIRDISVDEVFETMKAYATQL